MTAILREIYDRLLGCYGPQHWWPGDSPFEVMVGAILTQSAAWGNVEKALANLKGAGSLSAAALRQLNLPQLARLIRPSGYYNAKAQKLKALAQFLEAFDDDLARLFSLETGELRRRLLSVHGIGEETADSIILYAAAKPTFVVDAYTRRILERLGLGPASTSYAAFQAFFQASLPQEAQLFNEYHALLVRHGKEACRKLPRCPVCCLRDICAYPLKTSRA